MSLTLKALHYYNIPIPHPSNIIILKTPTAVHRRTPNILHVLLAACLWVPLQHWGSLPAVPLESPAGLRLSLAGSSSLVKSVPGGGQRETGRGTVVLDVCQFSVFFYQLCRLFGVLGPQGDPPPKGSQLVSGFCLNFNICWHLFRPRWHRFRSCFVDSCLGAFFPSFYAFLGWF